MADTREVDVYVLVTQRIRVEVVDFFANEDGPRRAIQPKAKPKAKPKPTTAPVQQQHWFPAFEKTA